MNFFSSQAKFWPWFFKVLATFFKARPLATAAVIFTTTLEQVTSLLAMLLPLKVILLAGSEGVPRYFAFFIDPAEKGNWIIILSVATVAMFTASSIFETISRRLSQSVSGEVLETANEITVIANQEQKASSYYSRFCSIVSCAIFFVLSLAVLWFINKALLLFITAAIFIEVIFTSTIVMGDDTVNPGRLKNFIVDKVASYLGTLKVVNFLTGFFVILYPYLLGVDYNILFAIISMVLLRQSLNMLGSLISDGVALSKAKHRVNTLVFRHYQLENKERSLSVVLRDLFPNHRRERMAAQHIDVPKDSNDALVSSLWVDSSVPSAKTFKVSLDDRSASLPHYFQQQVFPPNAVSRLNNEMFLFEHVSRSRLKAPEVVSRFAEEPFECVFYQCGNGEVVSSNEWRECEIELLTNLWSCQPPRSLVEAYSVSHPMLHKKIKDELVSRVEVAIDTEKEERLLSNFKELMPDLLRYLSRFPVYIFNPDLKPGNVMMSADGSDFLVMTWTRWKILPLGAAFPGRYEGKQLGEVLEKIREKRRDVTDAFSIDDMSCANLCYELEKAIRGERYKAALKSMQKLIECSDLYQEKLTLSPRDAG